MSTTLVIGDPHDTPEQNKNRFFALGNLINKLRPDNIVQIGDFMSLDSVSSHDPSNLRVREGKRIIDDIESGRIAYKALMNGMNELNKHLRDNKMKQYKPDMYWFEGNHEDRVRRNLNSNPVFEGMVPETDLVGAAMDGWIIVSYKEYAEIKGTLFTHAPMNKRNNQPISGEYIARRAVDIHSKNIVFGHTHRLQLHTSKLVGHDRLTTSVNVGWFGDYVPEYLKGNELACDWWSGVIMITHMKDESIDIDTISIKRVMEYL